MIKKFIFVLSLLFFTYGLLISYIIFIKLIPLYKDLGVVTPRYLSASPFIFIFIGAALLLLFFSKRERLQKFILTVVLILIALGFLFYYGKIQSLKILTKKFSQTQQSESLESNLKPSLIEILDVSTKSQKIETAIELSETGGCQPEFFDPKPQQVSAENLVSVENIIAAQYKIKVFKFTCASSFDYVLDIGKDNKRVALFSHVDTYYLNDNKNLLFLNNYLKNQEGKYELKRRIISVDGTQQKDIPSLDCVSRWAKWDGDDLITYSNANNDRSGLQGDAYNNYKTKICIWDENVTLKNRLQAKLTWYGASSDSLWAKIGTLPKDPNIFYAYDNNYSDAIQTCSLFYQDLKDQSRNKVIDLFVEADDQMPQHLCPAGDYIKLDLSNAAFDDIFIEFKLYNPYGPNTNWPKNYQKYINWRFINSPIFEWIPYTYYKMGVTFDYPSYWKKQTPTMGGQSYLQEIKDPNDFYTLTVGQYGNYNQLTGKPYNNLKEYLNLSYDPKEINIGGQVALQPLPRSGSENIYETYFFSKDLKSIYTISLEVKKDDSVKFYEGQEIFTKILNSIKFSEWKTYSNSEYAFLINYPEYLKIKDETKLDSAKLINGDNLEISFEPTVPVVNGYPTEIQGMYLSVTKNEQNLKDIVEYEKSRIYGHIALVPNVINETSLSISGIKAIKISYSMSERFERANVFFKYNGYLYAISMDGKLADQILANFKFNPEKFQQP